MDFDGASSLDDQERFRYSRQMMLPGFGEEGQHRLKESRVLIVGVGGLGCPAALYLTAAGVGTLGIADSDEVSRSNLQRQVLFQDSDVGKDKATTAKRRLEALNPDIQVHVHPRIGADNAMEILEGYDVVVDGSDNFLTRYLVNDATYFMGIPLVSASVNGFHGQVAVFHHDDGGCYRCLYPHPPPPDLVPSCADAGVLGVVPGILGVLQATQTIKILTGMRIQKEILVYDALGSSFRSLSIRRNPDCPLCGVSPDIKELCASEITACNTPNVPSITCDELQRLQQSTDPPFLLDVRDPDEWGTGTLRPQARIPLWDLHRHMDGLPRERRVIAYCRTGSRSAEAVRRLRACGIDARNLAGGIEAWQQTPWAVVPGNPASL